jgi:hypothetical protein
MADSFQRHIAKYANYEALSRCAARNRSRNGRLARSDTSISISPALDPDGITRPSASQKYIGAAENALARLSIRPCLFTLF